MAFDMHATRQVAEPRSKVDPIVVKLVFTDSVFGPVKALQLFAAINELPERYYIGKANQNGDVGVELSVVSTPRVERVLAKIFSMPTLESFTRNDVTHD